MKSIIKEKVLKLFHKLKLFNFLISMQEIICRKKYIRVVNYHCTPYEKLEDFKKQINFIKKYYQFIKKDQLEQILKGDIDWNFLKKPGLLLTFDDGLKCNLQVARYLSNNQIEATFCIPTSLIAESNSSIDLLKDYQVFCSCNSNFMNKSDLEELLKLKHNIIPHTCNHKRLGFKVNSRIIYDEIVESSKFINALSPNNSFAWVGGEFSSYSIKPFNIFKKLNIQIVFNSNAGIITSGVNKYSIGRSCLDPSMSNSETIFHISQIFFDRLYSILIDSFLTPLLLT